MKKRWYVTSCPSATFTPEPGERAWTVSRDPDDEGWTTDSGCEGYGLTHDEATELAEAANEKWEREHQRDER